MDDVPGLTLIGQQVIETSALEQLVVLLKVLGRAVASQELEESVGDERVLETHAQRSKLHVVHLHAKFGGQEVDRQVDTKAVRLHLALQ